MRIAARGASSRACLFAHIERIASRISRRATDYLAGGLCAFPFIVLCVMGVPA